MSWSDVREIVTQIWQFLSPARALAKFGHVSDWPTPESVKQEMLDREREARVRSKYKYAYTSEEAGKLLLEPKTRARDAQDAQRRWFRR